MSERPNLGKDWTNDRADELKRLEALLIEVKGLNHGGGVCERIALCESIAEALTALDLKAFRKSFIHFLTDLAIKDRFPEKQLTRDPDKG